MEVSKVTSTKTKNRNSYSLRTTIPRYIVKSMDINEADILIWNYNEKNIIITKQE